MGAGEVGAVGAYTEGADEVGAVGTCTEGAMGADEVGAVGACTEGAMGAGEVGGCTDRAGGAGKCPAAGAQRSLVEAAWTPVCPSWALAGRAQVLAGCQQPPVYL
jgi:hypothetical protein